MPQGMGGLNERMGIELVEISADRVVATMPVAGNTQPYGLLHGGASVVLAESLGSIGAAINAHPDRGRGRRRHQRDPPPLGHLRHRHRRRHPGPPGPDEARAGRSSSATSGASGSAPPASPARSSPASASGCSAAPAWTVLGRVGGLRPPQRAPGGEDLPELAAAAAVQAGALRDQTRADRVGRRHPQDRLRPEGESCHEPVAVARSGRRRGRQAATTELLGVG